MAADPRPCQEHTHGETKVYALSLNKMPLSVSFLLPVLFWLLFLSNVFTQVRIKTMPSDTTEAALAIIMTGAANQMSAQMRRTSRTPAERCELRSDNCIIDHETSHNS